MNGEIHFFIEQRLFNFLGEKAFTAEFGERPYRRVAAGTDDSQLDSARLGEGRVGADQPRLDFPGLNQRQGTASRPNGELG